MSTDNYFSKRGNIRKSSGLRREVDIAIAHDIAQWSNHKVDDVLAVLEVNGRTREFLFILATRLKRELADTNKLRLELLVAHSRIAELETVLEALIGNSRPDWHEFKGSTENFERTVAVLNK